MRPPLAPLLELQSRALTLPLAPPRPRRPRPSRSAISSGFISESNRAFLVFVDGPSTANPLPSSFDWGDAALEAIRAWKALGSGGATPYSFEWTSEQKKGKEVL